MLIVNLLSWYYFTCIPTLMRIRCFEMQDFLQPFEFPMPMPSSSFEHAGNPLTYALNQ